jgi:hypothetical protein
MSASPLAPHGSRCRLGGELHDVTEVCDLPRARAVVGVAAGAVAIGGVEATQEVG